MTAYGKASRRLTGGDIPDGDGEVVNKLLGISLNLPKGISAEQKSGIVCHELPCGSRV